MRIQESNSQYARKVALRDSRPRYPNYEGSGARIREKLLIQPQTTSTSTVTEPVVDDCVCPVCGKQCKSNFALTGHMRSHKESANDQA